MWRTKALSPASQKRAVLFFGLGLVVLFFVLNRGAYQSFFQDDEFDTLSWASKVPWREWLTGLFTPYISPKNFRPVGHAYYLLKDLAGFQFTPYIAVLQLLHLLNSVLVWRICRKVGIGPFASLAGGGFFLLNMAAIYAYWKPMNSFDVLCTTFSLATFLLWANGQFLLSFISFWLAYKGKEPAVMLPAALALYQFWFGEKRNWWKVIPFFAVSLSFGLQAVLANRGRQGDYQLRLGYREVLQLADYYLSRIALVKHAGFALLLLPLLVRDRRVWWGVASMCIFLVPFLMLPGRVFDVYTYLPLSCFAVAVGTIAGIIAGNKRPVAVPVCAAIFFVFWAVRDFHQLQVDRRADLAVGQESRAYFRDVVRFARAHPQPGTIVYAGFPITFHNWGVNGLFHCVFPNLETDPVYIDDARASEAAHAPKVTVIHWDHPTRRASFLFHEHGQPEASFVTMDENTPLWLLDGGWYPLEGNYRWTKAQATAHLQRPVGATEFVLSANIVSGLTEEPRTITVSLDGAPLGSAALKQGGAQEFQWPLKPGSARLTAVAITLSKPFQTPGDTRILGIPVTSFGFR